MKNIRILRRWLMFWALFIGIGALVGAIMMFIEPQGGPIFQMAPLLAMMQVLPFANVFFTSFIWPAIALMIVNGIPNFIGYVVLLKRQPIAPYLAMISGIVLMLWTSIQLVIFSFNGMSFIFCLFGLVQAITGYGLWRVSR